MSLKTLTPEEAKALAARGAVVIDVRDADEFAREHIPGARNEPLSALGAGPAAGNADIVIYHCKSGMRTKANAPRLAAARACEAYILEGGIEAWKSAGLPVAIDKGQPLELMRQVQIAAGSLVVIGVVLGAALHPAFYLLSGFVGAGRVFAGVSGFCGMARLLTVMPWNRALRA